MSLPKTMRALVYQAPRDFSVQDVEMPTYGPLDIVLKVSACGVCGTDGHIHEGEFLAKFPLIPGHEAIGKVVAMGKDVQGFSMGDRVVADVSVQCEVCFYCRRGQPLFCEIYNAKGVTLPGGFAEYIVYHSKKCYVVKNLTDEEATLLEPAACALHGLDKLRPPVGSEILLLGAGPTGLILSQLLKMNGASKVVLAANKGLKMDLARKLDAADVYIDLDRQNPDPQWEQIKKDNPHGFDIVVEATGVEKLANMAIDYVRRGGTLMLYGVYENKARVHWSPMRIFNDEINIIGSFSQVYCFPRAIEYLDSGKINVKGMVTDVFKLEDFQGALDKMNSRSCLKIAIKP